jgi:hypothetical protein
LPKTAQQKVASISAVSGSTCNLSWKRFYVLNFWLFLFFDITNYSTGETRGIVINADFAALCPSALLRLQMVSYWMGNINCHININ